MKFPEAKTWNDDRAMTINPSGDNYKIGYNDALKDCKAAYAESVPTVEEILEIIDFQSSVREKLEPQEKNDLAQSIVALLKGEK